LLNRCTGLNLYPGFESLPHRQRDFPSNLSNLPTSGASRGGRCSSSDRHYARNYARQSCDTRAVRPSSDARNGDRAWVVACGSKDPVGQNGSSAQDPRRLGRRSRRVEAAGAVDGTERRPQRLGKPADGFSTSFHSLHFFSLLSFFSRRPKPKNSFRPQQHGLRSATGVAIPLMQRSVLLVVGRHHRGRRQHVGINNSWRLRSIVSSRAIL
jgi:hypothetical protein